MEEIILTNKTFSNLINEKLKKKKQQDEETQKAEQKIKEEPTEKSKSIIAKSFATENAYAEKTDNLSDNETAKKSAGKKSSSTEIKDLSADQALNKVYEIEQKYLSGDYIDLPDSLGLEKVEVPNKTKEEISNQAKNEITSKYDLTKEKSNQSFQNKIDDIIKSNQSLISKNQENKNQINSYYDASKKETENQALKRGLARSSIIIGELASLEGSRANELANLLNSFQTTLDANQKKIEEYQAQKQQAIEELDIKQALEIEQKISDLTDEYNKARQDAISFNNNVQKLETEYEFEKQARKQELQHEALKIDSTYKKNYIEQEMRQKQYDFLKEYFDSLEPSYALNLLLTNKSFKDILGNRYPLLYQHIAERA